jgi:hypothetical protein
MDMVVSGEASQMSVEQRALERRAQRYASRCLQWRERRAAHEPQADRERHRPAAVVSRLCELVAAEIACALSESSDSGPEQRIAHADAYASAAIALIAIEQSRQAWLALVRDQDVRSIAAQPFVSDLVWLKHEVERAFPGIRFATTRAASA